MTKEEILARGAEYVSRVSAKHNVILSQEAMGRCLVLYLEYASAMLDWVYSSDEYRGYRNELLTIAMRRKEMIEYKIKWERDLSLQQHQESPGSSSLLESMQ